jgi:hypothetical protein
MQSEILLLETDATMDVQNVVSKRLGERSFNGVYSMSMHGGLLYMCGTSSSGESELGDILFVKLNDIDANPIYYYVGDGVSYKGSGFDLTDENGFVLTGASYLNEKSLITLYKVNSEGNL